MAHSAIPAILAGWRREESDGGIVLTVQLAYSRQQADERRWDKLPLVLSDRQLRSLTRDLTRAAEERGIRLFAPMPWWRRLLGGAGRRLSGWGGDPRAPSAPDYRQRQAPSPLLRGEPELS